MYQTVRTICVLRNRETIKLRKYCAASLQNEMPRDAKQKSKALRMLEGIQQFR